MGLRVKVTLILVIIVFIQISCKRCMPRTPTKSSLKRYLNNLKAENPTLPSFANTGQNANTPQYSRPLMYEAYNFPEIEYPLDTSSNDPFNYRMNGNTKYQMNKQKATCNLQNPAINDLKKKRKIQRKLSSYKQITGEKEMSPTNYISGSDPISFLDSGTFPEVQYPGNAMDSWAPSYWNYFSSFTKDQQQFDGFGQQTFYPKAKESTKTPLTKLSKSKAYEFLKPYHKLKEEHRRVSTESSKRSSLDEKGARFTKTPTCEKILEDFISDSIVSSISNSDDVKQILKSIIDETSSSESSSASQCTKYLEESLPIPYKVITQDNNNVCYVSKEKNNYKNNDTNGTYIAQSVKPKILQSVEAIFNDDMCTNEPNLVPDTTNTDKTIENTLDYGFETIPSAIAVLDNDNVTCVNATAEALSTLVPDDQRCVKLPQLPHNITKLPAEEVTKNVSIIVSPLNDTKPFTEAEPSSQPENDVISHLTNTATSSNTNSLPSHTSIIIIPINNAVGESQSQFFEAAADRSIIVYIPTSQANGIPPQTIPLSKYVSSTIEQNIHNSSHPLNSHLLSALDKHLSYNNYRNVSDMVPILNDKTSSPGFLKETPSISLLQKYETLPTNSMCYKNNKWPSSACGKSSSDNFIKRTLPDTQSSDTPTCGEKLYVSKYPLETFTSDINAETLPSLHKIQHLPSQFCDSDLVSLSDKPDNNYLINELPIGNEDIEDLLINETFTNDSDVATIYVTPASHKNATTRDHIPKIILPESHNVIFSVPTDNDLPTEAPNSVKLLTTNTPRNTNSPLMNELLLTMDKPPILPTLFKVDTVHAEKIPLMHEKIPAVQPMMAYNNALSDRMSLKRDHIPKSILTKSHKAELSIPTDNNLPTKAPRNSVEILANDNPGTMTLMNELLVPMDKLHILLTLSKLYLVDTEKVPLNHEEFTAVPPTIADGTSLISDHIPKSILFESDNSGLSVPTDNYLPTDAPHTSVKVLVNNTPETTTGPLMNELLIPMEKTFTPRPHSKVRTENEPLMHETLPAIKTLITLTDKLIQLMNNTRLTSAAPETHNPLPADDNLSPTLLSKTPSDSWSLHKTQTSLSKTISVDSQLGVDHSEPINAIMEPILNFTNTNEQILPQDNNILSAQHFKTETSEILLLPINKTLSSNPASENLNDRITLSRKNTTSTNNFTATFTENQPLPIKEIQSLTPLLTNKLPQNSGIPDSPSNRLILPSQETHLYTLDSKSSALQLPTEKTINNKLMGALDLPAPVSNTFTDVIQLIEDKNVTQTSFLTPKNQSVDEPEPKYFTNSSDSPNDTNLSSNLVAVKPTYTNYHNLSENLSSPLDKGTAALNYTHLESQHSDIFYKKNPIPSNLNEIREISNPTNASSVPIVDSSLPVISALSETRNVDDLSNDKHPQVNNLPPSSEKMLSSLSKLPVHKLVQTHNQSLPKAMNSSDLETKNLIQSSEKNLLPHFEIPFHNLNQSLNRLIPNTNSDFGTKNMIQVMDKECQDSLFTNVSLDNDSNLTEDRKLLPSDKVIDVDDGNLPTQNDDTEVGEHEIQNTSFADSSINSQSLSTTTSSLSVNEVFPLFPSNAYMNDILLPGDETLLETAPNTDFEDQPLLIDSTLPYDELLLENFTTDSPKNEFLTEMNHSLPILDDKQLVSLLSLDFNNTIPDSSVYNTTSDGRSLVVLDVEESESESDNAQSPLSDVNNGGQLLDKETSKSFISNTPEDFPFPLEYALSESASTGNGLVS